MYLELCISSNDLVRLRNDVWYGMMGLLNENLRACVNMLDFKSHFGFLIVKAVPHQINPPFLPSFSSLSKRTVLHFYSFVCPWIQPPKSIPSCIDSTASIITTFVCCCQHKCDFFLSKLMHTHKNRRVVSCIESSTKWRNICVVKVSFYSF